MALQQAHQHTVLPSISSLLHRHHLPSQPPSPDGGYQSKQPHLASMAYYHQHYTMGSRVDGIASGNYTPPDENTHSTHKARWRLSKYCTVENCERVSQRNGLCHSHGGKRSCKEISCRAKDRGNGYCIRHGGGRPCKIPDCPKKARRQGMCTQHYRVIHPN
ncbi:hypothetical protein H310_07562 [Aphanomyces invadans]|uniref:Uncharacterized protein n=1 Tax=Aphanomyces invadans TaxID=157072 RepID=A0A024U2M5_9STRA|nr:hypothetical protein H310_07562 [Aphanomyces invadans]ETW00157.1 hypothetical protein H310_07562 [Aphanomyces invadans]|eukprot:XP_008871182.1 hypothetical protein H310_07562 [Aphanomyces invadans]